MEIDGYIKSGIVLPDGGNIFFPESLKHSIKEEYEIFKDKYGRDHRVLIAEHKDEYTFDDSHIEIEKMSSMDWVYPRHKILGISYHWFQFNLVRYFVFTNTIDSQYMFCKNLIDYKPIEEFEVKNYDALRKSDYYPLTESCTFGHPSINNYISDKCFFNFYDRRLALSRIDNHCREKIFNDFDYINATDSELWKFVNDRFKKRLKYEQLKPINHDSSKQ